MALLLARRSTWSPWPAALVTASAASLGTAAVLWATSTAPAAIPATPVELSLTLSLLGSFALWRRPGHRVAALIAVAGVLFSVATLAAAVLDHTVGGSGYQGAAAKAAFAVGWLAAALPVPWMLLVLWFPDGEFTGAGWRRGFVVAAVAAAAVTVTGYLFAPPGRLPSILAGSGVSPRLAGPFGAAGHDGLVSAVDALSVLPLLALPALVGRYRRADAPVRQQIRWLLVAAVTTIIVTVAAVALGHGPAGVAAVGGVLALVAQPLPALAITVALLRYRLWDVDVVISRTLVYGLLWAVLSVLLLVPALISGYLVGGPGTLTAVGAALVVTLAFQPIRRRLQDTVDNRVYGPRRVARLQLARAGDTLRAAGDVDVIAPRVAQIVREALAVPWAALWVCLRSEDGGGWLRPVGSAGAEPVPARLSAHAMADLLAYRQARADPALPAEVSHLLPTPVGAVMPLVVADQLVGVIACGNRAGEPMDERDLDALARFAGECALGLRGLRLDAELRQRLREIEEQAEDLRSSRKRLVRAQDDERRRIERNLHDGVQQQLVGLATRIRQLALRTDDAVRGEWERIAADAEDAVFALQDVARGIFPVVLVDQGLAVALRAHAGRSALPVRLDLEPSIMGRRFDPEIEASLYYVALEALTNVAKHAPDAQVVLTLRVADSGDDVLLEVHDDGPGLSGGRRREGSGLVNMRDRVAAVGGTLELDSRPGAGTWVRAAAPLPGIVVPLHRTEVDSRR
jgi:signal transduction histidine kinase